MRKKRTVKPIRYKPVLNRKQTAQLQKALDAFPIAIVLVDSNGHIQYMDQTAKALLGETEKQLNLRDWPQALGLYLDDGIVPYPGERLVLLRVLQGETVEDSEEIILQREGEERRIWISMSAQALKDEDGNIEGAVALIRDITHRKQMELSQEKHIQRLEALYKLSRLIAEAGHELNHVADLAAKFTSEEIGEVSIITLLTDLKDKYRIAAFHDTGPSGQAQLRKLLSPEAEYDLSDGLLGGVIQSGEPLLIPSITPQQLQTISSSAFKELIEEMNMESALMVPLTGRGSILGAISLYRPQESQPFSTGDQTFLLDIAHRIALAIENCRLFESLREEISKRLSAKEELEWSEERFRSIFESVTLGIKVLDLEGNILQTNRAYQEMIGYTEDELKGKHYTDFVHPQDIARASKLFHSVRLNGVSTFRFEHRKVHKDESIVWAKTFFTVVKKSGDGEEPVFIVGIVENVTEQKRLQFEMEELNRRLQSAMELERLYLAQELHDNPMQVLYSANYRLEELRTKADPEMNEALREVKDTIQGVLQDLRAIAKELRPPTIFSFGLENAIRSHAYDIQEKHPNLDIHLSLAHDGQSLPDNVRLVLFRVLQQALANVVRHAEASEVRIHFSFDAEETHLEVTDNGKGFVVPDNWIEFVRQEHYGLAGAAERVSALGGVFKVESKPGNSTTVRVTIPWSDE
ncbi:MAG TPA: PAS domain S-box protein [Anaerolineales bacterium]|nr:PAS domain S-box protein [Anaerolineales bacterium]